MGNWKTSTHPDSQSLRQIFNNWIVTQQLIYHFNSIKRNRSIINRYNVKTAIIIKYLFEREKYFHAVNVDYFFAGINKKKKYAIRLCQTIRFADLISHKLFNEVFM